MPQEVVPLFLRGLEKLNSILDLIDGTKELSTTDPESLYNFESKLESIELSIVMIQETIFGLYMSSAKALPYDVLEVSVKAESASAARELFREITRAYLPEGIPVHLSTKPGGPIAAFPYILVYLSNGARG